MLVFLFSHLVCLVVLVHVTQLEGPTTTDTQRAAALFRAVLPIYIKLIEKEAPAELPTLSFRALGTDMNETANSLLREQNSTFTSHDFSTSILPMMLEVALWRRAGVEGAGYFRLNKKTGNVIDKYELYMSAPVSFRIGTALPRYDCLLYFS